MVKSAVASKANSDDFLNGLSAEQRALFRRIAGRQEYRPGEAILRQREKADRFFLIENGRVTLEYELPRQKRVKIQEMGAGEALGWSWLTPPNRWQFSATAIDCVTLSVFRVADLRQLFKREPELGYWFMERAAQALLERLQATRHKLRAYVERASGDENTQQVC
jgi:CRP-like cAMP-binding protein